MQREGAVETDGDIAQMFHPSLSWVEVPDGVPVEQNWVFVGGAFPPLRPSFQLNIAGLLSEEDADTCKSFAAYKLALNKVDQQLGCPADIKWPEIP